MSSKLSENEHGLTYTLEAILGAVLIISTVLFFSNSLPYVAQKTGEHSKVQLMNIGRDNLDLIEVTPIVDINPGYWAGLVYRNYTLVADKTFVMPGENVTFTVYTLGYTEILYHNLSLRQVVLGLDEDNENEIGIINGTLVTNFYSVGEYNVRAVELDESTWSNYVTIKVGYYFLDTDISGISAAGDMNVSGVVYNSTGSGVPGLKIEILDNNYVIEEYFVNYTEYGIIVDDCENDSLWTSSGDLGLNSTNISNINESHSISIYSDSDFWLKKTISTTYNFDKNDILSFYFYSINENETIDVELSNSSYSVTGKLNWNNTNSLRSGWNKINTILKYPTKVEGNIKIEDVDTIEIKVSNITKNEDYLFDNFIAGEGRFSFIWPDLDPSNQGVETGPYYLQASDTINTSNRHRILFSESGLIVSDKYVIYEGDSTLISLIPGGPINLFPNNRNFNINHKKYTQFTQHDLNKISLSEPFNGGLNVNLTANTAGDYYILYGTLAVTDEGVGQFTNTILIKVLPADGKNTLYRDSNCGGINITQLNDYMRLNMPAYVNYNLYLINPDGTLCDDCPEFKELINGYPTGEAVVVNKLIHLNQGSELGFMRELRMVLWYK